MSCAIGLAALKSRSSAAPEAAAAVQLKQESRHEKEAR